MFVAKVQTVAVINEKPMKYEPIVKNNVMIFELEKPVYGSHFGIWDKWLRQAKEHNYKLVVITKFGTATYPTYREWVIGSRKEPRYYKNPDVPMIYYGRDVLPDIKARELRKKAEKKMTENVGQNTILAGMAQEDRAKLRAKLGLRP